MSDTPETSKLPQMSPIPMSELCELESQEDRHKLTRTERVLLGIGLVLLVMIGGFIVYLQLVRARISANEGSAIGTLRVMSTAQAQYQSCAQTDQDSDGTGEYGLLGEMAGTISRRSYGLPLGTPANPTFITRVLGPKNHDPWGTKSGYHFQVFLAGQKRCTTDQGVLDPVSINPKNDQCEEATIINTQEVKWRGYAWPISQVTGTRCFAVNQAAEVMAAPNITTVGEDKTLIYQGEHRTPKHDAAAESADQPETMESNLRGGAICKDGQVWAAAGS